MTLSGKKVLITGGGSGIGLACAQSLAAAGARVIVSGRDKTRLETSGFDHELMDVTDEANVRRVSERTGPMDIVISNAGAASTAPVLKTRLEMWNDMLAVNLTGAFLCAKYFIPGMVSRGWGRFIVIGSTASLKGYAYSAAYCAAKHGVLGLVRALAVEQAKSGVTVNALCPGFTRTPLVNGALETIAHKTGRSREDALHSLIKDNPMGRLIEPEEVASAALWLCSDDAAAANGQALVIDGGELAA